MAVTHLVVSLLLIHILTLDRSDAYVALMFGVFIDVDHLFGLKGYIDAHGVGGVLDFDSLINADGPWKSMLHSPIAVMIVGPVATASRLALPLVFWGIHITMDYAEDTFLGLFSIGEMALLAGCFSALLLLSHRRACVFEPGMRFGEFLVRQLSRVSSPFSRVRSAVCGPRAP